MPIAELAIILVNYRGSTDTVDCVRSLRACTYRNYTITIVDNGSGSEAVALLSRECPDATLIVNQDNLGFAKANNLGIERALSEGARYVLLLNNDTVVDASLLSELLAAMDRNPSAGVVGPKILYYDRPNILWFAGGSLNARSAKARHLGIGESDSGQYDREGPVDFITGCCLLVRRDVFARVGMLDPDYFAYYEDSDFCLRVRRAGYNVVFVPSARLRHKVSSTAVWEGPVYLYFTLRNRLLFLRKNSTFLRAIPFLPALAYFYLRHLIRLAVKWRSAAGTRAALFGLIDGLRGYTGENGKGRLNVIDRTAPR